MKTEIPTTIFMIFDQKTNQYLKRGGTSFRFYTNLMQAQIHYRKEYYDQMQWRINVDDEPNLRIDQFELTLKKQNV